MAAAAKKAVAPAAKAARKKVAGTAARKPAAAKKTPVDAATPAAPAGLLRAGLKALGTVRDDVVKRQTHVIESLLGMGAKPKAGAGAAAKKSAFPSLDSFGIRKFEDVFDQRVATAMQRLGMPTAEDLQALREQMSQLLEALERIERREAARSAEPADDEAERTRSSKGSAGDRAKPRRKRPTSR